MVGKFLYFAYGSNLLAQRIHINNPSAVRAGIAKLEGYQLSFITYSRRWRGCSATIVQKQGSHVWGALWEIDNDHLASLDNQEGVSQNLYIPLTVNVTTPDGKILSARTYQQTAHTPLHVNIQDLPEDRRPSGVYTKTILKGSIESGLPSEYHEFLKKIPHNGYEGEVDIGLPLQFK